MMIGNPQNKYSLNILDQDNLLIRNFPNISHKWVARDVWEHISSRKEKKRNLLYLTHIDT